MREEICISLGNELNIYTFETILTNITNNHTNVSTIIFDLSELKFVKLGGLISFLSLCGAIKEKKLFNGIQDIGVQLKLPPDNVLAHLHRMQFFKIARNNEWIENCDNLFQKDKEYFRIWKNKLTKYQNEIDHSNKKSYKANFFPFHFIPPALQYSDFDNTCTRFINDLIEVIEPVFEHDLSFNKEQKRAFWQSNRELYKNIFDHSESWGLMALQVDRKNVVLSFSDIGIGIMESLKEYLMLSYSSNCINDCLAIKEAIKKSVSSKNSNKSDNMGLGLYLVTEYVKKANGKMIIRSGECLYPINSQPEKVNFFPGTQIHIAIPVNKQ